MSSRQPSPQHPSPTPPRIVGDDGEFVFEVPPAAQPSPEVTPPPAAPRRVTLRVWQLMVLVAFLSLGAAGARWVQPPRLPDPHRLAFALDDISGSPSRINVAGIHDCHFVEPSLPDDLRIVFVDTSFGSLYLMSPTTAETCRLAMTRHTYAPRWSPDGTQILFGVRREDGQRDLVIWSYPSTFSHITNTPEEELSPSWAADGKSIFFVAESRLFQLVLPELGDFRGPTLVSPISEVMTAAISPNDDWMAVGRVNEDRQDNLSGGVEGGAFDQHLTLRRLDGSSSHLISLNEAMKLESSAAWSSDGRWVAWINRTGQRIWIFDREDETNTAFFATPHSASALDWLPTNDGIAFIVNSGRRCVIVAQMFSGVTIVVADLVPMIKSFDWR